MQNSYVSCLQGLYESILTDISRTFPTYHREAERDMSRILHLIEHNGIEILTITFPFVGKHLDKALSRGVLTSTRAMGFAPYGKGTTVPRLFKGLWLRVFNKDGVLQENPDINAILSLRQLLNAAKKLRITCDESKTISTVRDFFRLDESLRLPSLSWGGDRIDLDASSNIHLVDGIAKLAREPSLFEDPDDESGIHRSAVFIQLLERIQQVADIYSSSLGWFDPAEWRLKHGPGAVSDAKFGSESKYSFPTWPDKLDRVFPMDQFGFANAGCWVDHLEQGDSSHRNYEAPSKLIAVPKTQKGPRLIASEPVCHQWAQQAVKDFLTVQVGKSSLAASIHFRDQTHNQDLARQASQDGMHATIDLSSASDCVSCWLVERIFRRNKPLLEALHASRTRWLENQISHEPKYHKIRKFAAMGAATTFPVQTIIYAVVIAGSMLDHDGQHFVPITEASIREVASQFRVFGDDLVIPSTVAERVAGVLRYLGFKVNHDKTHTGGVLRHTFRESCGAECFGGSDVTPAYFLDVYDKSRPSTVATLVETSNNFFMKGFWVTAEWIKSTLPQSLQQELPVVKTVSGQFGLLSFSGEDLSHLKKRWNSNLQISELRALTLTSRSPRTQTGTHAELLQFFSEEPNPDFPWESGYAPRPTTKVGRRWVPETDLAGSDLRQDHLAPRGVRVK